MVGKSHSFVVHGSEPQARYMPLTDKDSLLHPPEVAQVDPRIREPRRPELKAVPHVA
jgi:hypothetical protein